MKKTVLVTFMATLLLASACTPTPPPQPQHQTWIDKPLPNMTIPDEPYTIVFHAASTNGITQFDVSVDGVLQDVVAPQTTGSGGGGMTLFYAEYQWTPPGPGSYQIRVRSMNGNSDYGPPVEVNVTVEGEGVVLQPAPTGEDTLATPTPTLEPVEVPAEFGPPQYSDREVYYRGTGCGLKQLTIEIMIAGTEAYSVVVFYRLRDQNGEATSDWSSAAMSPVGGGLFRYMLAVEGGLPDVTSFPQAFLQLQFVAMDEGGDEVARTDVFSDVTVEVCGR